MMSQWNPIFFCGPLTRGLTALFFFASTALFFFASFASGVMVQEALTGQTAIEQLVSGHINPFGDGQGVF